MKARKKMRAEVLLPSSQRDPAASGEEVVLLDPEGHLTPEAMAFSGELGIYQQGVVERHLVSCDLCALQRAALARIKTELRGARPRLTVPPEIRLLGEQAARKSLMLLEEERARSEADDGAGPGHHGQAPERTGGSAHQAPTPSQTESAPLDREEAPRVALPRAALPWYRSPTVSLGLMVGAIAALLVAAMALIVTGCRGKEAPPLSVTMDRLTLEPGLGQALTAALGDQDLLVGGTASGQIWLSQPGQGPWTLVPAAGSARVPVLPGSDAGPKDPAPTSAASEAMVHDGPILALALSGDRQHLVSAGGKRVTAWHLPSRRLTMQVRGPQGITALALSEDGRRAFFGTEQGHVLSWATDRPRAEVMPRLPCAASLVPPARRQLPPNKRCRFGTFITSADGQPACVYPVTLLHLVEKTLFRACREGTLGAFRLDTSRATWLTAGHLTALAPLPDGRLVLARADGRVDLYDPSDNQVVRHLVGEAGPTAAAAWGEIVAVAAGTQVRIFHVKYSEPLLTVKLPSPGRWLSLRGDPPRLRAILSDGRLASTQLTLGSAHPL